jgi:signal transduction histidine kinase/DNA-binding NarL/FixJ family response regulator
MTTPLRILYVDDSPFDRELVRDVLEKERQDFLVIEAASRQEFESRLANGHYDLVLSDFNILGFEGLQVLDAVRAKTPTLPVIIVTGTGSEEVAVEAMKRGANDYVLKTVKHIQRLPLTIHTVLEKTRLQQERERAQEALREEATTTAALARVGRELIALVGAPLILERLCELSAEALQCDCSYTLLWRPKENAYQPVASWGYSSAEQQTLLRLTIPRQPKTEIEARMRAGEEAISVQASLFPDHALSLLTEGRRLQTQLHLALRRGREIIGMHVCGYFQQTELSLRHLRIAQGISQLASFALANAYLFEELQQANRIKADFLATISHELRTPLNIILGYTGLLIEGMFGALTEEQTSPLHRVDDSAKTLLALITDTLDISRLETGQMPVDLQEVNLHTFFNEVKKETQDVRERPEVHLLWTIAPDLPSLYTDPAKLKIIVKNLLTNAVKFTERGSVLVSVGVREDQVEISVADTGIGMTDDVLPIIFEPFRQGDGSATRRYGGVGLGLYIVRRLLDLLGGTVRVESVAGQGSTFRIQFPITSRQ